MLKSKRSSAAAAAAAKPAKAKQTAVGTTSRRPMVVSMGKNCHPLRRTVRSNLTNPVSHSTRHFFADPLAPPGSVPRNRQNPNLSPNQPDFAYISRTSDLNKELYGRTPKISKKSVRETPAPKSEVGRSAIDIYTQPRDDLSQGSKPSKETLKIVDSIEEYNSWIGKKMSQPVFQALQSLFITHGLAAAPETISTTTPKQHILQTLLNHGIIVPNEADFQSTVPQDKLVQKQPHVLEFLKTMRQFGLFPTNVLQRFKPGYANPDIAFVPGRFRTDQLDPTLETPIGGTKKNPRHQRTNTVIDTMIDCLRLSGAFDVQTISPQTLKSRLSGLLVPPPGEGAADSFDHVVLEKYSQAAMADHECTRHSIAWFQSTLKNEVSIPVLQQLHAKYYRYDISFAFRTEFEDLYNKMMSFDQDALLAENPGVPAAELVEKYAPTKAELQLFRTLIYDEHVQTRFYQHFIKSPNQNQFVSVNNASYATIFNEKRAQEAKHRQSIAKTFGTLQQIARPEDYPEVYNVDLGAAADNETSEAGNTTAAVPPPATKKKHSIRYMVLPPEENFILTTAKKAFYLLIADNIIPRPPAGFDGTMQEWICSALVTQGVFKTIPPDQPEIEQLTLPQIPHPNIEGETVEIDTEEHELLDLMYDMGLVPDALLGRIIPARQTPMLLRTDDETTDHIKRLLLDAVVPLRPVHLRVPKRPRGVTRSPDDSVATSGDSSATNTAVDGGDKLEGDDNGVGVGGGGGGEDDHDDDGFETVTAMRRPTPQARRVIDAIIDAQQLDLEEQEPVEGLIGNTSQQVDTTWPKFIQVSEGDSEGTEEEFVYEHDSIEMKPFKRDPEADQAVTEEIASFDAVINNLDPTQHFPQMQSFLAQFYRHDICLTFARRYPRTFAKLIRPSQPEFDPQTHANNTNATIDVDFVPPVFSPEELDNVRWLLSNLHLQYHLVQRYRDSREDFEFEVARARQTKREVPKIEFNHVLIGGGFDDDQIKAAYTTGFWKAHVLGSAGTGTAAAAVKH